LKQALVTGGSRGIGAAVARALAADGFRVWIHYGARGEAARVVAREIFDRGDPEPLLFQCDLANRRATAEATEKLIEQEGAPEALVLSAGITHGALFALTSDEDWDRLLATNLGGLIAVGRPIVKGMLRARSGRIVVLSSVVAWVGNPGQVAYAATKGALSAAALSLARELEPRGITVNVVAPGLVDTEMLRGAPVERLLHAVPAGRLGRPTEVAHVVRYLCSADGRPMTGRVFHVDGGMSLQAR
jgi:3-oxoacyl-[acyl-carrier protein] reductase